MFKCIIICTRNLRLEDMFSVTMHNMVHDTFLINQHNVLFLLVFVLFPSTSVTWKTSTGKNFFSNVMGRESDIEFILDFIAYISNKAGNISHYKGQGCWIEN